MSLTARQKLALKHAMDQLTAHGNPKAVSHHKGQDLEIAGIQWEGKPALNVKCPADLFRYVQGYWVNTLRCKVVQIEESTTNLAFVPR
jgi:hypothetical protein